MSQTKLLMRRIVAWIYAVGGGLYVLHGMITSTGLIGWLEVAQQSLFGSYSMKLSMLVAIVVVVIPALVIGSGQADPLGPGAVMQRGANAPLSTRGQIIMCAVAVALVWIAGFTARTWYIERARADAEATYVPLRLETGDVSTPPADHVALYGKALDNAIVASRSGSGSSARDDHFFIPIVARDWQPGQPVRYVLKSETSVLTDRASLVPRFAPVLPGAAPAPAPPEYPVLARPGGALPVPAQQALANMGLVLGEPQFLLDRIDSYQGKPVPLDSAQVHWFFLFGCGLLSGTFVLAWTLAIFMQRKKQRQHGSST
jgi:hypothetical protein